MINYLYSSEQEISLSRIVLSKMGLTLAFSFMKIRVLGEGHFGKVTLAKMTFGCLRGQLVAVKESLGQ